MKCNVPYEEIALLDTRDDAYEMGFDDAIETVKGCYYIGDIIRAAYCAAASPPPYKQLAWCTLSLRDPV